MTNISETDGYVLSEGKSGSGSAFQIGYPKSQGYDASTLAEDLAAAVTTPSGYEALEWKPGEKGYISPGAENLGIQNGYVSHDRGTIYPYRINFYNSRGWHFTFIDESGDTYGCTTIRNGWHYIDYKSDKPIIVGVK